MPKNDAKSSTVQATEMVELAKTYLLAAEGKMLNGISFSHKEKLDPLLQEKIRNAQKQIVFATQSVKVAMAACDTVCIQASILATREDRKIYDK